MRWDVFCRVIDNHGDLGVCWRLSADLARRGHTVRLWVDDASALRWMAPQGQAGVQVLDWSVAVDAYSDCADVVIEAFGCELPERVQAHIAARAQSPEADAIWINLEYLSAEPYVERQHGLPSPVMAGPAKGCTKWFFFPGFTERTGGLLREPDLLQRQAAFDREAWRASHGHGADTRTADHPPRWISLFCYEPAGLPALLQQLPARSNRLLVTPGRATQAVQTALTLLGTGRASLDWQALPYTDQAGFDVMLWACDLNLVRGEDSLVRALWAGQPLVWQIYPQDDGAHHAKLEAFLDWLDAPVSWRVCHRVWNGLSPQALPLLDGPTLAEWQDCLRAARERLLAQPDLVTQLLAWIARQRAAAVVSHGG